MNRIHSRLLPYLLVATFATVISCKKDSKDPETPPNSGFTATKQISTVYKFTAADGATAGLTYDWNFGDGSAHSTEKNPSHTYLAFSHLYHVSLKVTKGTQTTETIKDVTTESSDASLLGWYAFARADAEASITPIPDNSGNNKELTSASDAPVFNMRDRKNQYQVPKFQGTNDLVFPLGMIKNGSMVGNNTRTSISIWIYPTDLSGVHGIMLESHYTGNVTDEYVPVLFTQDNVLKGIFWDNDGEQTMSSGSVNKTLQVNHWYHIVLAGDETGQSLYLNGELVGHRAKAITHLNMDIATLGAIFIGTGSNWLGQTATANNLYTFKGALDDIRVYNRALTAAEVSALYSE